MDIKDAIQLIESGRFFEIDIEDLWELESILSSSTDPQAVAALISFQNSPLGHNLPQASLQLKALIDANSRAVQNIESGFNLFALDSQGRPQSKEVLSIFNFFRRVNVDNKPGAEIVKAENLFAEAAEIGRAAALKDLYLSKSFAQMKPEEQKKTYINTVLMAMEENAFVLVSNQTLEKVAGQKRGMLSLQEKNQIKSEVERRFADIIDAKSQTPIKLSNNNIIGTFVSAVNRTGNIATRLVEKSQSPQLAKEVLALDKKLAPRYPDSFMMLRPLAKVPNMGIIAGHVGKSSFAAANIAEAVRSNNPAKKQKNLSLFAFLREQPRYLKSFSDNIVGSIKKVYNGLVISMSYDIVSSKVAAGWNKMIRHFSGNNGDGSSEYKGLSKTTMMGDLKNLNAKLGKALNVEPSPEAKVYAWKEFGAAFRNSKLGRALNPERTVLISERPQDYTKVVKIELGKPQVALVPKRTPLPVKGGEGIPRIAAAQIRRITGAGKA